MALPSNHQWNRQNPGLLPASRKGSCMAYDAHHAVTVLFGGGGFNDTWLWDGRAWSKCHPLIAPPARTSACMAYDAAHRCTVLFGGVGTHGSLLDDTWTWDGETWTERDTAVAPAPRCGACMTYDETRQHILLFGGQTSDGRVGMLLHDTWIWDGERWTRLTPPLAPPARLGASMLYHEVHQHALLFGGTNGETILDDTWTWNGADWTRLAPSSSPPARAWASSAYHGPTRYGVLIGGHGSGLGGASSLLGDTWLWNGLTWARLPTTSAPVGGYHCAACDVSRQTIVLYAATTSKPDLGDKTRGHIPSSTVPQLGSETWLWLPTS